MPDVPSPINIPQAILDEVFAHAREAFPAECCGWLEGPKDGDAVVSAHPCVNVQSQGSHPTVAGRGEERAYIFSAADVIAFNEGMDADAPPLIIYHSHPNGRAYFSETDTKVASNAWDGGKMYPVQQLVVGIDESRVVEAVLFDWSEGEQAFVEIQRFAGVG
jgi:proteasome lid subunit RPN8/RPN11